MSQRSCSEVIQRMEEVTGRTARLEFHERQSGDALHTGGDGTQARSVLGFVPQVDLRTGLAAEAAWMQRYLEGQPE